MIMQLGQAILGLATATLQTARDGPSGPLLIMLILLGRGTAVSGSESTTGAAPGGLLDAAKQGPAAYMHRAV